MQPTPYTHAVTHGVRIPQLDHVIFAKGIYLANYDPTGERHGIPTYPYRWAPAGLLTTRQLRTKGLRPGGQHIAAQIIWRQGKRVAYLYREDLAKPKRTATPAQQAAINKALRARRVCPTCHTEKTYYIARSLGECNDCAARWDQ
jgi:rubredoxin